MIESFNRAKPRNEDPNFSTSTPLEETRELIRSYPDLTKTELMRLIQLYRKLSALDMALMLSDEKLAPKLDRFSTDNRSKIRTPFRQYAALLLYAVLGFSALAWAAFVPA